MSNTSTIRRINFIGGPGSGKSTTAAWLYSELKSLTLNNELESVELVREFIKDWAYLGRKADSWDNWFVFANQLQREKELLVDGNVRLIVSDSPLIVNNFYARNQHTALSLLFITREFENQFPSINIFLKREDRTYVQPGRYENEEEALKLDDELWDFVARRVTWVTGGIENIPFISSTENKKEIWNFVKEKISIVENNNKD